MYGLVPYNISPIQQAIQYGHAVVEYGQEMKRLGEHNQSLNAQYNDWADNWKTFMILNGGTSNHSKNRYQLGEFTGTMESHRDTLAQNCISFANFYEPDLNDMLSAIVFIVDERVFNKDKYPDFDLKPFYGNERLDYNEIYKDPMDPKFPNKYALMGSKVREEWEFWVESIGGGKNLFLRTFLKNFRLA